MKLCLETTAPEKHLELLRLGFHCDNGNDYRIPCGLRAAAYLWAPDEENRRQWRADVEPNWSARDPRHPRFDDPIVAAIWIKTELGL